MIEDDTHVCEECGTGWNTITAANECATIDAAETRQLRSAAKKRKPWDDNIIRGYN
jgi:ribose 5-phosphate isomerase RpiB